MFQKRATTSFNSIIAMVLLLLTGLAFAVPFADGPGETPAYQEGVHYTKLPVALGTVKKDKVEVREFFSYMCPHCFQFESVLHPWVVNLPEDVVFQRTPAVFRPDWEPVARAYFVAEALEVTDKAHPAIFEAIHVKRKKMTSQEELAELFSGFGVSAATFNKTYRSFGVGTQVKQAAAKLKVAQVTGVPNVLVNGKYLVGTRNNGGFEGMLRVVEHLVEIERQALAKGAAQ